MPEDTTPNDTFFSTEVPKETEDQMQEERKLSAQSAPFIEETMAWFDEQIDDMSRISTAKEASITRKLPIEVAIEALDLVCILLAEKKAEFNNLKMNLPQ